LLYRINTIEITLPPLRERVDDIAMLARHFVSLYARKYRMPERSLTGAALDALKAYRWPGNVRELSHTIERAMILGDSDALDVADFDLDKPAPNTGSGSLNLNANEKETVRVALEQAGGNISHAAKSLGITRAALYRRIDKFGL
jgi:transcriptional regulator with PAS, ATPase and Fis domain